jgi:hypothetical protein
VSNKKISILLLACAVVLLLRTTTFLCPSEAHATKTAEAPAGENETAHVIQDSLVIPVSQDELMRKVRQSLSAAGRKPASIKKIVLDELGPVYVAAFSAERRFARVVARTVPCMDCHDVFFVYSFDDQGKFLDFVPIHITKRYNREWEAEDFRKIWSPFAGKSIQSRVGFNPKADAVTSATMSSKLVFHSLNQTHAVYRELMQLGYITH